MTDLDQILKQLEDLQTEKQTILADYAQADAAAKPEIEQRMQANIAKFQALYQAVQALAAKQ